MRLLKKGKVERETWFLWNPMTLKHEEIQFAVISWFVFVTLAFTAIQIAYGLLTGQRLWP